MKENICGTISEIAYTTRNGSFTLRREGLAMSELTIIFITNALFGELVFAHSFDTIHFPLKCKKHEEFPLKLLLILKIVQPISFKNF